MGTAWELAISLVKEKEANRTRLLEDPHRIPEISITEYTNYRKAFLDAHPEQFLTEHREPNKRFVEKGSSGHHPARRSTGFTRTPEMLMRLASEDVPVNVTLEEDAMARIYAFFVTLEYLNLMSFAWYNLTNGVHSGSTLDYLMELEERRRERPGVNFILLADKKFPRKVFKVCSEKKELYLNYSAGLRLAMTEFRDFWQEARMEVYQPPVQVPVNPKREPEIPKVPAGRGEESQAERQQGS